MKFLLEVLSELVVANYSPQQFLDVLKRSSNHDVKKFADKLETELKGNFDPLSMMEVWKKDELVDLEDIVSNTYMDFAYADWSSKDYSKVETEVEKLWEQIFGKYIELVPDPTE